MILADEQNVVPGVARASHDHLAQVYGSDGKLHGAPELTVEILSPGSTTEGRDRELRRKLYSRIGVSEYWIADWRTCTIEVYRRAHGGLQFTAMLHDGEPLTSPLLPGFALPLADLWDSGGLG